MQKLELSAPPRRWLSAALLVSCFAWLACDAGTTNPRPAADAANAADATAQALNGLGTECTTVADCPTMPEHNCVILTLGNPNLGYCSPACTVDQDCINGYTGPSTGTLSCFVPNQPNSCSIGCAATADCPGNLECKITGGPFNFCATR